MERKLLYLGPGDLTEVIRKNLPGFEVAHAVEEHRVANLLADCDAVLDAYMKIRFPANRLQEAARLKLFVTATTGSDHIDHPTLEKRGIPLLTLRGQTEFLRNITPAAEHSWLLLMACARKLSAAVNSVLQGEWERNDYPGLMLKGKTLGIIGCGRIGGWMSRYANAFGMKCLGFDPFFQTHPEGIEDSELTPLLQRSDFIAVHVPLNQQTTALLGRKEFSEMKKGAILINTSRGEVLDELALLEALQSGQIAAAGLDVLKGEPEIQHHPLVNYARKNPNVIITPHIGGFSPDALKEVLVFSCQRIANFFDGRTSSRTFQDS